MWDGGVENQTGLDAKGFFVAMFEYFGNFSALDWAVFGLKLAAFVVIFFMVPTILKKLGFKGWVPPEEEEN